MLAEQIDKRISVRSYTREFLAPEIREAIGEFINERKPHFGAKNARVELVKSQLHGEKRKLGTYGVIGGTIDYLVLLHGDGEWDAVAAGYMFEEVVLFCTKLGLGTCWMGATFKREDFEKAIDKRDDETLRIVSPVGYCADKKGFTDRIIGAMSKSRSRLDFEELFISESWGHSLTHKEAGDYLKPLEMVRLAPSARNKQPWRAVKKGDQIHFYKDIDASDYTDIDMGIALCHFELGCMSSGIKGGFKEIDNHPIPVVNELRYVISWDNK